MTDPGRMAFPLVRGGYGAVLLCAPGTAIRLSGAGPASSRTLAVTRVLGARHLIQAAVTAAAPNAAVLTVGAQVDCAHAASMLAVAAASRPLRRAGLADGLIATVLAVAGLAVAGTGTARPPRRQRARARHGLRFLAAVRWLRRAEAHVQADAGSGRARAQLDQVADLVDHPESLAAESAE